MIMDKNIWGNLPEAMSLKDAIVYSFSRLDSKTLLSFGGMVCLTALVGVGIVCFSGSEMSISKSGFSITQGKQHLL